jgi:hypothetical protein
VLLAAVAGVAAGSVGLAEGIASAHGPAGRGIFPDSPLAPGTALSGRIHVDPADRNLTPYLKVLDVRNGCLHLCPAGAPALSDVLQIRAQAPDGSGWTKRLEDLTTITALTGGDLTAQSSGRTYQLTATLPDDVTNRAEALSTSFVLQWGLMDAKHHPVTRVLGESFRSAPDQQLARHELPFTGSDIVLELLASVSSIYVGVMLVGAARRRWQP